MSWIWMKRIESLMDVIQELKSMTKKIPAGQWTPEYRALAERIHSAGRDHAHTDILKDMYTLGYLPKNDKLESPQESPIEIAYRAMGKMIVFFPNCPLCGRAQPGHHTPDCDYLRIYDAVRIERGESNS